MGKQVKNVQGRMNQSFVGQRKEKKRREKERKKGEEEKEKKIETLLSALLGQGRKNSKTGCPRGGKRVMLRIREGEEKEKENKENNTWSGNRIKEKKQKEKGLSNYRTEGKEQETEDKGER